MKTLKNKPLLMNTASATKSGKVANVQQSVIKLREISTLERQSLRIPGYKYLLP